MLNDMTLVKIDAKTLNLGQKLSEAIQATGGFEIQESFDTHRPDLMVFQLGKETENDLHRIQAMLERNEVGEIFLISKQTDPSLLINAMRAGVKEFFSEPIKPLEIKEALDRYKKRQGNTHYRKHAKQGIVIDVIGSKGGVGTTTVAVNLAVALADNNQSVALVDMNMVFGEIPLFLALKPDYHWGEITKDIERLDANFLMDVLSKHPSGVHVLSSPSSLNGNVAASPEVMGHLLSLMKKMFGFVVIDGGQSLNDSSLRIIEMSNNILLVSLLSLPCLANAGKIIKSFGALGHLTDEDVKVVINRYLKDSDLSIKDAQESINREVFWTVANDYPTAMAAINRGKGLLQFAPNATITKNLCDLADALAQRERRREKKRFNLWGRIMGDRNGINKSVRGY